MMQIQISPDLLIGKGRDRACYRHPLNENLCIKVPLQPEKQTLRENWYFSYLRRRGVDLSLLAPYQFPVNTNLGVGAAYPLIRNKDGQVAETLKNAILSQTITYQQVRSRLTKLKSYLFQNRICVRDMSPSSIVCLLDGENTNFIIIDGVMNPGINPLNTRIRCLTCQSVVNAWQSLERKTEQLFLEVNKSTITSQNNSLSNTRLSA